MILYYSLMVLYVLVCLMLLLVILLQQGKGGDMASAFGGGSSQTAFGARAGATLMTKLTTIFAVLFMVLALALAILGQRGPGSLVSGTAGPPPAAQARDDSRGAGHACGPRRDDTGSSGDAGAGHAREIASAAAPAQPDVILRTSPAAVRAVSSVGSPDRSARLRAGLRRAGSVPRRSRRERRRRHARWQIRHAA